MYKTSKQQMVECFIRKKSYIKVIPKSSAFLLLYKYIVVHTKLILKFVGMNLEFLSVEILLSKF